MEIIGSHKQQKLIYSIFSLYLIVSRSEEFFKVVDNSTQQKTIEKIVDTENL